jgi:trehalose 6-phosphate synthase
MASRRPHSKIFVVSNRLPISVRRTDSGCYDICASSGGLICALEGLVGIKGFSWYGWPGIEVPEDDREEIQLELRKRNAVPIFLEDGVADKYYNGFSSTYDPLLCEFLF